MIECAKCGHRNADGTEFCQNCGTFLGYEGKKLEALPGTVLISLATSMVPVAPGSQASAEMRVRNRSNVVDQYEIQITGDPASWTVAEPSTLALFPDKEGLVTIRFRPPRSADVSAGPKPFTIKVQSKASPEISARQEGVVEVAAIEEAGLTITPHTARGGESATYRLVVQNEGNAPLQLALDATDPDELLMFDFDRPALTLGLGEVANVQLVVKPRATFYKGPPQPHPFTVKLRADGLPPMSADATLLQEAARRPKKKLPIIPVLVGLLAIVLLASMVVERQPLMRLVAAKHAASPSPTPIPIVMVKIPEVACTTPSDAQQTLTSAGFNPGALYEHDASGPGTVFKTQPAAGEKAPKGSNVTLFVSTGPAPGAKCDWQVLNPVFDAITDALTAIPSGGCGRGSGSGRCP